MDTAKRGSFQPPAPPLVLVFGLGHRGPAKASRVAIVELADALIPKDGLRVSRLEG